MKITKQTRNALLSVSIGDGYVDKHGAIIIKHSIKQLDYLKWKKRYLERNGVKTGEIVFINNNGFPGASLYIPVQRFTKLLRRVLYKGGRKNIYNRQLLNRLSPEHLAIWYMDDGGLSQKKQNGVVHANDLMINTHTSRDNNQILINYFNEVWGVSFTQVKNKGHYRLRCGTKEARKFLEIIRDFVKEVPSMQAKLNVKSC